MTAALLLRVLAGLILFPVAVVVVTVASLGSVYFVGWSLGFIIAIIKERAHENSHHHRS